MNDLPAIALEEFTRRRDQGRAAHAARASSQGQVEAMLRPWAALVRWFGAALPRELCDHQGTQPHWIDFAPPRQRADHALADIAREVRRAATIAHAKHLVLIADLTVPANSREQHRQRASNLLALDHHLSIAADLPPIDLPATPAAMPVPASAA